MLLTELGCVEAGVRQDVAETERVKNIGGLLQIYYEKYNFVLIY